MALTTESTLYALYRSGFESVTAPPDATLVRAETSPPAAVAAMAAVASPVATTSAEGVYDVRRGDSSERIAT